MDEVKTGAVFGVGVGVTLPPSLPLHAPKRRSEQ
jgi:hypothetical protein